jgi:Zn-dependent protease/predicted transcriptional regulator
MRGHIRLGRIAGIEISLHYTWFIIAALITFSLIGQFHYTNPDWSSTVVWVSAIITGILFFGALILHELAHSLVALRQGLPVRSITLFALGGVSQIEHEAMTPGGEFWMAIAGPVTSGVVGLVFLLAAQAIGWGPSTFAPSPEAAILGWLGYINIALGVFNMIPGFPLDGGRVLRSIVWKATGNADRSTRIAARIGQAVAVIFIVWGLFRFVASANFGGLWIAFIGWFLLDAAMASYAQAEIIENLRDLHVGDFMTRDCTVVPVQASVQDVIQQLLRSSQRCFVVEREGHVAGLVALKELRTVPRQQWAATSVATVMQPLEHLPALSPETPAVEGLELMMRERASQLPVVSEGRLEGVISRHQILELLQSRHSLKAA